MPGRRSERATLAAGLALHLLLSAGLGALFTAALDRIEPRSRIRRALAGAGLGTIQWLLTYYGVLVWAYPPQVRADPVWVAASTHAGFGAMVAAIT